MKTLLLISTLIWSSFVQAELTHYNYSGKVTYTNNEQYFTTGEIVNGTFAISAEQELINIENRYNGHLYVYRDIDPSAHSNFNASQIQMDVTNISPSEFIYDVESIDGLTSISLKSKRNWAYEIFLDIRDMPGVITTIPNPIDINSANSKTMFVQQDGNFAEVEITSIEVFDGNTCQEFCSYDFELTVSSTQVKNSPVTWNAVITNKTGYESTYSFWLVASQNSGTEYPLSDTKRITVGGDSTITTSGYKFLPKKLLPNVGQWKLTLYVLNETDNEGPYQRSIIVNKR